LKRHKGNCLKVLASAKKNGGSGVGIKIGGDNGSEYLQEYEIPNAGSEEHGSDEGGEGEEYYSGEQNGVVYRDDDDDGEE